LVKEKVEGTGATVNEPEGRVSLQRELNKFIQTTEDRGSVEAAQVYRYAADEFLAVTGRIYADEIPAKPSRLSEKNASLCVNNW
jgi:hypothetical protein